MNELIRLDHRLFEVINGDWSNDILDSVMPVLTDLHKSWLFIGLTVVALGVWIWKEKKKAARTLLALALAVALSETLGYRVIKNYVSRPRPEFTAEVHALLKSPSHSGESFPSLHASNNFAGATVLSQAYPPLAPVFFAVATLIAFSRVYVGVHFPADVLGGALLGIFCGWIVMRLLRRLKVT